MHKSIVLIGLPGSGKTTIGQILAKRLNMPFIDTDQQIEQHLKQSIRSYFDAHGEQEFRAIETQVLKKVLQQPPAIISSGGGIVTQTVNRELLKKYAINVYLNVGIQTLFQRLKTDKQRPLLQVDNPFTQLQKLQLDRAPYYQEIAHVVIESNNSNIATLMDKVLAQLHQHEGCKKLTLDKV